MDKVLKDLPDGSIPDFIFEKIERLLRDDIQSYAKTREKCVIEGRETGFLASTLLEKYALGIDAAVNIIGVDFSAIKIADEYIAKLDPDFKANTNIRWGGLPADINAINTEVKEG